MSAYKTRTTDMDDGECLVETLKTMGFTPKVNFAQPMHLEGYQGDRRLQKAEIVIPRAQVGVASNDIGFAKNAQGKYSAIVSEFDQTLRGEEWQSKVLQTYGEKKSMKIAKDKGYEFIAREVVKTPKGDVVKLRFQAARS